MELKNFDKDNIFKMDREEFDLGYKRGYKHALIEIEKILDEQIIYFSKPEIELNKAQIHYINYLKDKLKELKTSHKEKEKEQNGRNNLYTNRNR